MKKAHGDRDCHTYTQRDATDPLLCCLLYPDVDGVLHIKSGYGEGDELTETHLNPHNSWHVHRPKLAEERQRW